jgi:F-type H+-transporting ATPase subunit b
MTNENPKPSGAPYPALLLIGVVLMVGGTWLSINWHPDFIKTINEKGLPVDPGMTVATIGVLIILFPLVNLFFIKPLASAIGERNGNLERTFAEVEELRDDMTKMKLDYEKRLVQTEANAREQIQNHIKEAQILRQTLTSEAAQRAELMVEQARIQIDQEKKSALLEMRSVVVDMTLGATQKLIGENLDSDRSRKLIDDFIQSVEVKA